MSRNEPSVPFLLSVFRDDPDPRVRAKSLLSIGRYAPIARVEACFRTAIEDPQVRREFLRSLSAPASNFLNREDVDVATAERVAAMLLGVPGLPKAQRERLERVLAKKLR